MTFNQVDPDVAVDDASFTGLAMKWLAGNIRHTQQNRPRSAAVVYDARDPLVICGMPEDEAGVVPYLWAPAPGTTHVKLTVRVENPTSGQDLTLGISASPAWSKVIPDTTSTVTVTGAAAVSYQELTVDVRGIGPLVILWLHATSTAGAAQVYYSLDISGTPGSETTSLGSAYGAGYAEVTKTPSGRSASTWGPGGSTWSDDLTPYWIRFGDCDNGGAFDPTAFDPDDVELPGTFLCQRMTTSSSDSNKGWVHIWPRAQRDVTVPFTALQAIARLPISYGKVTSVHIQDTTAEPLPPVGTRYDAGAPTTARGAQVLVQEAESLFATGGRVRHLGGGPSLGNADVVFASSYMDPARQPQTLDTTYRTVLEGLVGGYDTYEYGGNQHRRTGLTGYALVAWVDAGQSNAVPKCRLYTRLSTSAAGGGSTVEGTAFPYPSEGNRIGRTSIRPATPGEWLWYAGQRYSVRGMFPRSLWKDVHTSIIRGDVQDDTSAPPDTREVRLEVRLVNNEREAMTTSPTPHIMALSGLILDTEGYVAGEIGVEV